MIDSATGMKPGERYLIESAQRTRNFPGFFLDGKYSLAPELLTAVGCLEGQKFLYDELFHAQEEHPLHTGYPSSCFRETVRRYWPFTKIKQR